jgi:hypothetical protein
MDNLHLILPLSIVFWQLHGKTGVKITVSGDFEGNNQNLQEKFQLFLPTRYLQSTYRFFLLLNGLIDCCVHRNLIVIYNPCVLALIVVFVQKVEQIAFNIWPFRI